MYLWHLIMFSKKLLTRLVLLIAISLFATLPAEAQCAMCKAIAESNSQGGGEIAAGLNTGILYLMVFPYLIIAAVAYAFYRQRKLNSQEKT